MLVLSRKTNESICIGPDIHVRVLAIRGGRVRLGIEAPREVSVHRSELEVSVTSDVAETGRSLD